MLPACAVFAVRILQLQNPAKNLLPGKRTGTGEHDPGRPWREMRQVPRYLTGTLKPRRPAQESFTRMHEFNTFRVGSPEPQQASDVGGGRDLTDTHSA